MANAHRSFATRAQAFRALATAALAIAWAAAGDAQAQDARAPTVGGPGGAPYDMRCAPGDYLVGLSGRGGNWVDAIAPMCAAWDGKARTFLPPGVGPQKGGPGGAPATIACDRASAIVSLFGEPADNDARSVGQLRPDCGNVLTGKRSSTATATVALGKSRGEIEAANGGENVGTSGPVIPGFNEFSTCARGQVAVGIYGGAGKYLDRIGLICAPAPRAIADPVIVPKPPVLAPARPNIGDAVRLPPGSVAPDPAACRSGYVWREARSGDLVCVTPESRDLVRSENAAASSRVNPAGPYGPNTCISGFVWREAYSGDVVCVPPERRDAVRAENAAAASRRVGP